MIELQDADLKRLQEFLRQAGQAAEQGKQAAAENSDDSDRQAHYRVGYVESALTNLVADVQHILRMAEQQDSRRRKKPRSDGELKGK